MTKKEWHAAAVETLKALRKHCAKHPNYDRGGYNGCRQCKLNTYCGTRAPESITDEEIEEIATLAEQEAKA